jgi:hypothetical protein
MNQTADRFMDLVCEEMVTSNTGSVNETPSKPLMLLVYFIQTDGRQ